MSNRRTALAVALAALTAAVHAQAPAANPQSPGPHWAFVPPVRHAVAAATDDAWSRDDLDRIVRAALQRDGLTPSPEADRATLLRRVHLVLTGLPPRADDVLAFVADASPDAYERRVDALLASPACAEHLATTWLDLARFADTYGYQADFVCRTWPWRDWLLDALQRDLPYDRFLRELVAGDLLPDASPETRLATAFFRLHRQTNEGGSIDEEWRQEYVADRVETFGTAFLGMTLGCARCHDHKFDPITQQDFYALGSFFAIDESGLYPYSTPAVPRPAMRLANDAQRGELARLGDAVAAAERALAAARATAAAQPCTAEAPDVPAPTPLREVATDREAVLDGDTGITVPDPPPFDRDQPWSLDLTLSCRDEQARAVVLHTCHYTEDADTQGYQILLEHGHVAWQIVHYWPGSAIAVRTQQPLPLGRWVRLVVTYDGSSRAAGLQVYVDGEAQALDVVRDGLDGPATVRQLQLGARDRDRGLPGGRFDGLRVFDRCLTNAEVARLAGRPVDAAARREHALARDPAVQAAADALGAARRALHTAEAAIPEIMVLAAHPAPPARYVLKRGAYDQPDLAHPAPPDAPASLRAFDARWPRTRLGLAEWLCAADNPLVARVQVNRLWALCFGQGLVRTSENFGKLGEAPARPELLDTLACDFVAGGFRSKPLLRRIVCSATFRQASMADAALRERDPDNVLLARGPAFRLGGEVLRDQALAASGLLHEELGGPSVKPWQPPGLWNDSGASTSGGDYQPDTGPQAHRRSLYTFRKRTAPPPNLMALDAPSREVCTARRQNTDTPLQALVFLDDPVFVECAKALAQRVVAECADATTDQRLTRLFLHLAARPPRPNELAALRALFATQRATLADDAAALTLVGSTLLASDAVVMLR